MRSGSEREGGGGGGEGVGEGEGDSGMDTIAGSRVGSKEVGEEQAPGGADLDGSSSAFSSSASTSISMPFTRMTFRGREGLGELGTSTLLSSASISISMSFTTMKFRRRIGLEEPTKFSVQGKGRVSKFFGEDPTDVGVGERESGEGGRSEGDAEASSLIALTAKGRGCGIVSLSESGWCSENGGKYDL